MTESDHNRESPRTAHLPEIVRGHVERALPTGVSGRQVRIAQLGDMWLKPGGRAMRFEATQSIAAERVGFSWQARFPLLGPCSLHVVDDYADGDGKLEVRLFGLPLQRQRGIETVTGEALRYLAELPFAPLAIVLNDQLEWRGVDERSAEVAATVAGRRLAVTLEVNDDGDIIRSSTEMRLLKLGREWVSRPWGGVFGEYETLGGTRIPTTGEAYWELPEGRYVYWRATVTSTQVVDRRFERDEP
jgi:hypothetical protein